LTRPLFFHAKLRRIDWRRAGARGHGEHARAEPVNTDRERPMARTALAAPIMLALILGTATAAGTALAFLTDPVSAQSVSSRSAEWPKTDFSKHSVDLGEIRSGGPPKDGIPSIDNPKFISASAERELSAQEPVISLNVAGDARAYPLRILMWHEIVNDTVGGVPLAITYCPLCNSGLVFKRSVGGKVLDFGTTGRLRNSELVMYDRQTESWWQQFTGTAIVGEMTGTRLESVPVRIEAFERFAAHNPAGKVLVPNNPDIRAYGRNPYSGYDGLSRPFLYSGSMPENIEPMARVVAVTVAGKPQAVALELVRGGGPVEIGDVVISWEAGQNSALDASEIAKGRDIGNVVAQRHGENGLEDIVYDVTFAFAFNAFYPDAPIRTE